MAPQQLNLFIVKMPRQKLLLVYNVDTNEDILYVELPRGRKHIAPACKKFKDKTKYNRKRERYVEKEY